MEQNTKILLWNIGQFTINRIGVQGTEPGEMALLTNPRLGYNRFALLEVVERINPDIFVLIEVMGSWAETGTLIQGNGQAGLFALLTDLRRDEEKEWCLVPATNLLGIAANRGETIGVFYQNRRLRFLGPQRWPANAGEDAEAVAPDQPSGPYPEPWNACLPDEDSHNAAYVAFRDDRGNLIGYPQRSDRNPMLTTFQERHHRARTINLVSVHLPPINNKVPGDGSKPKNPKGMTSKDALGRIWFTMPDNVQLPPPNAVTVVAGDFNLNLNAAEVRRDLYLKTETTAGEWLFDSPKTSMSERVAKATPFKYLGDALNDNAVLRYHYEERPMLLRGYVADIVAGARDVTPGTDPNTYPPVLATLDVPLAQFQSFPPGHPLAPSTFKLAQNYGHVARSGGLSDHRAIYVEA